MYCSGLKNAKRCFYIHLADNLAGTAEVRLIQFREQLKTCRDHDWTGVGVAEPRSKRLHFGKRKTTAANKSKT